MFVIKKKRLPGNIGSLKTNDLVVSIKRATTMERTQSVLQFIDDSFKELSSRLLPKIKSAISKKTSSQNHIPALSKECLSQAVLMRIFLVCIPRYDANTGDFENFCSAHIFGAIIDEMRSVSEKPRRSSSDRRKLDAMLRTKSNELGMRANCEELSQEYAEEYDDISSRRFTTKQILTNYFSQEDQEFRSIADDGHVVPADDNFTPLVEMADDPNDMIAIDMYYRGGMNCGQIASKMGKTEGQVSHCISRGLRSIEKSIRILRYREEKKLRSKVYYPRRGLSWVEHLSIWLNGCESRWIKKNSEESK